MSLMNKNLIKQAPVILCRLLSPITEKLTAQRDLELLLENPLLLDKAVECANKHFVIANLYAELQRHSLLPYLPSDLLDYLHCQHDFMLSRNQRLHKQAQSILTLLNEVNLVPLLMKGGDTLFYDLYPTQGCRFMSDLDILLPPDVDSMLVAQEQLFAQGYFVPKEYQSIKETPSSHHAAPIYKEGDDCGVELHYKPLNRKSGSLLTTKDAFASAIPVTSLDSVGIEALAFTPTHKILHCFIHSEISHGYQLTDRLDIRQMGYFSRLLNYYADIIDWVWLREQLKAHSYTHYFSVYCYKVQRLFGWPDSVPLFTGELPSEKVLKLKYQSALESAMSQYYPLRRFHHGLLHILGMFKRERLQGQFEFSIDDYSSHTRAILFKGRALIASFSKPNVITKQVRATFSRKW